MQDLPWSGFSLHGVSLARDLIPRRTEKTNHRDTKAQRVRGESGGTAILLDSYLLPSPCLCGLDNLSVQNKILKNFELCRQAKTAVFLYRTHEKPYGLTFQGKDPFISPIASTSKFECLNWFEPRSKRKQPALRRSASDLPPDPSHSPPWPRNLSRSHERPQP